VLTSADCQGDFSSGVNVGGLFLDGRQSEFIEFAQELPHPLYDPATRQNDLMLVKLNTNSAATPVQLNFDASIPATNDPLTIIGYGETVQFGGSSDNLLQGDVNAISSTTCSAFWGARINTNLQVCAGVASGSTDICEGDEGGPLLSSSGAQVGIISFTNGCGQADTPGVYTRIR
jgi:trypsin